MTEREERQDHDNAARYFGLFIQARREGFDETAALLLRYIRQLGYDIEGIPANRLVKNERH